ncbi:nucleoprotein [Tetrastichus brontispae RNA virus 1]|nr:nucleoprotein [Tetrastichus brontispae RNA virus 1]
MSKDRLYKRRTTGKAVTVKKITTEIEAEYPSTWFLNNPGEKPEVFYPRDQIEYETLYNLIYDGFHNMKLNLNVVKLFLVETLLKDEFKIKLSDDWKSFGLTVGLKDEIVNIKSLLKLTPQELKLESTEGKKGSKDDVSWMLILLLAYHRLYNVTQEDYYEKLKDKMFDMAKSKGCPLRAFPSKNVYDGWALDDSLNKLVSGIDMLLTKAPQHKYSYLRICTLRTRFQDCSGLLSVGYFCKLVSLSNNDEFLGWLWTDLLASEIESIMKEDEEIEKVDSYTPYQASMKLVNKTKYSSVINPNLYFLIHSVGCLLGSNRSSNAIFFADVNISNNIQNAKVMAYAFANTFNLTKAFQASDEITSDDRFEGTKEVSTIRPTKPNGPAWYDYMYSLNFQLPEDMENYIKFRKMTLSDSRKGSIGEYVFKNF